MVDLRFLAQEGLCWALDFNLDPMTAIVAQYINGRIHVLEEIYLKNSNHGGDVLTIQAACGILLADAPP